MKIYTRTGDAGETSLFDGTRVGKHDPRVDAYGEIDETNAWLGFARASALDAALADEVVHIQRDLFAVGAQLADPADKIAARVTKATRECWAEAELHRVRGELLKSIGGQAAAEESFGTALTMARRQSAKLWELRAAMSLARLRREQGNAAEAHELLAPVYGWFTEGFGTPDLDEAKALLDGLASTPPDSRVARRRTVGS